MLKLYFTTAWAWWSWKAVIFFVLSTSKEVYLLGTSREKAWHIYVDPELTGARVVRLSRCIAIQYNNGGTIAPHSTRLRTSKARLTLMKYIGRAYRTLSLPHLYIIVMVTRLNPRTSFKLPCFDFPSFSLQTLSQRHTLIGQIIVAWRYNDIDRQDYLTAMILENSITPKLSKQCYIMLTEKYATCILFNIYLTLYLTLFLWILSIWKVVIICIKAGKYFLEGVTYLLEPRRYIIIPPIQL